MLPPASLEALDEPRRGGERLMSDNTNEILARIEAFRGSMDAQFEAARGDMIVLRGELRRLENRLPSMQDNMTLNMASADRAPQSTDNTRDELRTMDELLSAMSRQIMRLQMRVRQIMGEP